MFYLFEFFLPCVSNASLMVGLGRCIITMVAFVFLFSTLCCQMSPQTASFWDCIVISVAFVWLFCTKSHWLHFFTFLHCGFSNVSSTRFNEMIYIYISDFFSQFFPNMVLHLFLLLSTGSFHMSLQTAEMRRCEITQAAFVCVLKWVLKLSAWEIA